MEIKSGAAGADVRYLHQALWGALFIARWLWWEMFPHDLPFVVTSATEGKHKDGSRHYNGQATDIRTKDPGNKWRLTIPQRTAYAKELSRRLGDEYDVTVSKKYGNVHIELDPKKPLR